MPAMYTMSRSKMPHQKRFFIEPTMEATRVRSSLNTRATRATLATRIIFSNFSTRAKLMFAGMAFTPDAAASSSMNCMPTMMKSNMFQCQSPPRKKVLKPTTYMRVTISSVKRKQKDVSMLRKESGGTSRLFSAMWLVVTPSMMELSRMRTPTEMSVAGCPRAKAASALRLRGLSTPSESVDSALKLAGLPLPKARLRVDEARRFFFPGAGAMYGLSGSAPEDIDLSEATRTTRRDETSRDPLRLWDPRLFTLPSDSRPPTRASESQRGSARARSSMAFSGL
mmetsp:Transcript_79635/g.209167  ORF Transcript_79635/g.209167 Transcript_79635/m.209167 type:complete len:282 (+) Transcript_79635:763-1608(+)